MEEWDETKNTWYETISWRTDCRKYYWVRLHVPLLLHSHLPVLPCQQKPHFHYSWTGSWVHFHCHRTHQTSTRSGLVQQPHRDHLTNEPTVKLSVVFDNFKKKNQKKKSHVSGKHCDISPVYLLTPASAATSDSAMMPLLTSLAASSISKRAWGPTFPLA